MYPIDIKEDDRKLAKVKAILDSAPSIFFSVVLFTIAILIKQ